MEFGQKKFCEIEFFDFTSFFGLDSINFPANCDVNYILYSGPENLKESRPKKLVKSNKIDFTKNFFDQIPFFAISKMAKNQILN